MNKEIKYYSENKKDYEMLSANGNLSSISSLLYKLLNTTNNIVFSFPENKFNLLPLLAYNYCQKHQKDYLIVSSEKAIFKHLKNYQLLSNYNGGYMFLSTIPILIAQEICQIKILNMRIPKKIRNEYSNDLFKISQLKQIRKIIFTDYNNLDLALSNKKDTLIEELNINSEIVTDIGIIFFEKFEHILKNKILLENFKIWVKKLNDNNIFVIIHLSNPYLKNIEQIFNQFKSININNYLIRNYLLNSNENIKNNKFEAINDFSYNFNIEIIGKINLPNLSSVESNIKTIINELRKNENLPQDFYFAFPLFNNLRNLLIHPSFYMFRMLDERGNFLYGNFERFIDIMNNKYNDDDEYYDLFKYLISSINTYYNILSNTNRYGEKYHYSAESKNTFLINYLIEKNSSLKTIKNLAIIYYEDIEKRILTAQFEKIKLENLKIDFISYKLIKFTEKKYDEVIFPGIKGNFEIFLNNINKFHNIKILTYQGTDLNYVESKLKINQEYYINKSIKDLEKFDNKSDIINKFIKKIKYQPKPDITEELLYPDIIERILNNNKQTIITNSNNTSQEKNMIFVTNIETGIKEVIYSGEFTTFNKINLDETYDKVLFSELSVGDHIFRLGNDDNEIFKIIEEAYDIDEIIDFDMIKSWKEWFNNNIELKKEELIIKLDKNNIKLIDLYNEYQKLCKKHNKQEKTYQTFLGWIKDKRIGPDDPKDLLVLGNLTNYPDIEFIYEDLFYEMKKIRKLHIIIGKQLSKIITILLNRKTNSELNFQEQFIYDKLKIYQIEKIDKNL